MFRETTPLPARATGGVAQLGALTLRESQWEQWNEQLDRDSVSGKLDFLFDEAEDESKRGLLREWPPAK
jgi:hypothetical protein